MSNSRTRRDFNFGTVRTGGIEHEMIAWVS